MIARFLGLGLWALSAVAAAAGPSPAERVEAFHGALQAMMEEAEFTAREAAIQPHIPQFFDVETIARLSLGAGTWNGLDAEQKAHFVALQQALIAATYAQRFNGGGGPRFRVLETRQLRSGEVVRCQVLPRDGDAVSLDYAFKGDRVINVLADGVSDLSLRRTDYARVLAAAGFDGLLTELDGKIASARND